MNTTFRNIMLALAMAFSFTACEPSDSEADLGFPVIYIPQATVTGLDNSYPIPNGPLNQNTAYVCKFDKQSGKLDIALGVIRAGFIKNAKGFSVSLVLNEGEADAKKSSLIAAGTPAMVIPASACSIPDKITVESGENSGTCYVSVDVKALAKVNVPENGIYQKMVLGLKIENPSEYSLADKNTSVVVIIDPNDANWDLLPEFKAIFPVIE